MSRPSKAKEVCRMPRCTRFLSTNDSAKEKVILNLEEYECIRLIDNMGLSQEDAANKMGVARTTVTRLYESARKKIAEYLISGTELVIEGGNYALCATQDCKNCIKKRNYFESIGKLSELE